MTPLKALHVATATSGATNIAFCHSLGADIVTDYKEQEVWAVLANNSVNVVYDNYGAKGLPCVFFFCQNTGTYPARPGERGLSAFVNGFSRTGGWI